MLNKKTMSAAMLLTGLLLSTQTMAQMYVGGTVGQARWETSCSQASFCDTYDTAFSVVGGYNINNQWGAEVGYTTFGTIHASSYTATGLVAGSVKGSAIEMTGVYRRPLIDKMTGFIKLGVGYNKAELNGTIGPVSANQTTRSTKPMIAIGANYALTDTVSARVEISSRRLDLMNNASTIINNFQIGLQRSF